MRCETLSPCRPHASRDTGLWLTSFATRYHWELVLSDSSPRLLSFAPEHSRTELSRQPQPMYRPAQATKSCASVYKLIACWSSLIFSREIAPSNSILLYARLPVLATAQGFLPFN